MAQDITGVAPDVPLDPTVADGQKGISSAQQYVLDSIYLVLNDGGVFDLVPSMIELNIHEDIFSPSIVGSVLILDGSGFIEALNITGFNFIQIAFSKTGIDDPDPYNQVFRVYKIGERFQMSRQAEEYAIHFCSEELVLNEQIKVACAYTNASIDGIINSILTGDPAGDAATTGATPNLSVLPDKIDMIEQTNNYYTFIIPNLKPFEAINWLSTYAQPLDVDTTVQSADMLFYQNRNGFNFRSLQKLMMQESYQTYTFSPLNLSENGDNVNQTFTTMISFKFIKTFDALNLISSGGYANKLITIDPLLRMSKSTVFNYNDPDADNTYFPDAVTLNDYPMDTGYRNRFGKTVSQTSEAVFKLAAGNSDDLNNDLGGNWAAQGDFGGGTTNPIIATLNGDLTSIAPDIGIETYVPYRTAQLALINQTKVEFLVPGDPTLTVGSVVTLNIPSYINDINPDEDNTDAYYAADYLVTAVRHKLDITGVYHCLVEAVTDSVASEYIQDDGQNNTDVNQQ
jgi:hypothetical protein